MSPLKDTNYVDVEYIIKGESFVIRRSLNTQVNEDDLMQQKKIFFMWDVTSVVRYIIWL
jgi:hypothetical protein